MISSWPSIDDEYVIHDPNRGEVRVRVVDEDPCPAYVYVRCITANNRLGRRERYPIERLFKGERQKKISTLSAAGERKT